MRPCRLRRRRGLTTLELKVDCIRAARTDGRTLTAEGTVVHAGRRTATAEGKVLDEQGKLVAHATTTGIILQSSRRKPPGTYRAPASAAVSRAAGTQPWRRRTDDTSGAR
ncbi:hypothetical protein Shyhy01_70210 [Streptomyces hygroscopicus subsp. hygroscopicus]|nr:PaaI family thioesterase [Streptomyces hygroscopicus]GLX54072.1 hypothetical protein Shyhy01_70210 [Streptomyces hygroscopicus subsp. hygroscopicus]